MAPVTATKINQVTFTTVGYGDLTPSTPAQKLFTVFFVLFSVIVVGFSFGLVFAGLTAREEERIQKLREAMVEDDSWVNDEDGHRRTRDFDQDRKCCFGFTSSAANPMSPDGRSVVIAFSVLFVIMTVGTAIARYEGMTWIDGVYFSIVSASTVGYGDLAPHSPTARIGTALYIMFGGAALSWAATNVACIPMIRQSQRMQAKVLHQYGTSLDSKELKQLLRGDDNRTCTRDEFVIHMLLALEMVHRSDADMCIRRFDILDKTHDGNLNLDDL